MQSTCSKCNVLSLTLFICIPPTTMIRQKCFVVTNPSGCLSWNSYTLSLWNIGEIASVLFWNKSVIRNAASRWLVAPHQHKISYSILCFSIFTQPSTTHSCLICMPICSHIVQKFRHSDESKVRLNYSVSNANVHLFGLATGSELHHAMFLMVRRVPRRPKTMTIALLERLGRWLGNRRCIYW